MNHPTETIAALTRAVDVLVLCASEPNDERYAALLQALRDGLAKGPAAKIRSDGFPFHSMALPSVMEEKLYGPFKSLYVLELP